ncbi:GntR family transcriptional regulator [Paracoccus aestuarii]|uniref:GntR family transcriptional regulator n=1 Tax=Paracoccus aestuarii TaxID=453842 RepID=A0A418ZRY8_9RHOB|nr:GntR family transcriptional regulator [Paracoccus aestuarii]RJK99926.1 GntR family transcriptional regulator [Paracoccus aestuarii]WCR00843.1 GntR family transcriptional regulator [Paracoccus aestuarii]
MAPPLYQTVINSIIAQIAAGDLLPGGMLPSETQLAHDIGVSQGTARKALMMLEQHGIVRREQGRGTFVTARTPESSLFNFFRLRPPDGRVIKPKVLEERIARRAATPIERETLHGTPTEVIEIRRVRSLLDRRGVMETSVISVDLFSGIERRSPLPSALYVLYQQAYGIIVLHADEAIRASVASIDEATSLNVKAGTPLLRVERLARDVLDRTIERRHSLYLTEDLSYMVRLD